MDLAAVLYEDADAFGVEHFFELARTATDLSVDRFDQFHVSPRFTRDVCLCLCAYSVATE